MDKGIRPESNRKFAELLPTRAAIGNTAFRKSVMTHLIEEFSISLASAATHYNHSFQECKKANPTLVEGLGRADGKKGGRKAKPKAPIVVVPRAATDLATFMAAGLTLEEATAAVNKTAPAVIVVPDEPVQTVFAVCKKSDNSVIAEGLSFEDAKALVQKAVTAKKAKLYWI